MPPVAKHAPGVRPPPASADLAAPASPRGALCWGVGVFLVLAPLFVAVKAFQHRTFNLKDYDAGIYSNIAWNISQGRGFFCDVIQRNHLGEHFSPIMLLFAPLYRIEPTILWLVVAQALCVAGAIALLAPLGFRLLAGVEPWRRNALLAVFFVLAFFYRPVTSALIFEFHPPTLGMILVAGAVLALHAGRNWALALCVLGLLTTKELAALTTLSLALYAGLVLGRWRTAGVLAGVAGVAAAIVFGLVIPHFRGEEWRHYSRLDPFHDQARKLRYLAALIGSLAFLPILAPRALAPALLMASLNLLVNFAAQYTLEKHHDDQGSIFFLVAALHGLGVVGRHMRRFEQDAPRPPARLVLPALALLCIIAFDGWSNVERARRYVPGERHRAMWRELGAFLDAHPQGPVASFELSPYVGHVTPYYTLAGSRPSYLRQQFARVPEGALVLFPRLRYPTRDWRYPVLQRLVETRRLEPVRIGEQLLIFRVASDPSQWPYERLFVLPDPQHPDFFPAEPHDAEEPSPG